MSKLYLNLYGVFIVILLCACEREGRVHIEGEVSGVSSVFIYGHQTDSASLMPLPIKSGVFVADIMLDSVDIPVVVVMNDTLEVPVFAEAGDRLRLTGNVKKPSSIKVEGGDKINETLNEWRNKKQTIEAFVKAYPDHIASMWLCWNAAVHSHPYDISRIRAVLEQLSPRLRATAYIAELQRLLSSNVARGLELPFFGKSLHAVIMNTDATKADTTLSATDLRSLLDSLSRK